MEPINESRTQKRTDLETEVRLRSHTLADFIREHSRDISVGGVFVRSDEPMAKHTLVKLEIAINSEEPIRAVGRVIWIQPPGNPDKPAGMGIKFIKIDDGNRARIADLVERSGEGAGSFAPKEGDEADEPAPEAEPVKAAEAKPAQAEPAEASSQDEEEEDEEEEQEARPSEPGGRPFAGPKKRRGKKERREEARQRKQQQKQDRKVARTTGANDSVAPKPMPKKDTDLRRSSPAPAMSSKESGSGIPTWALIVIAVGAVAVAIWYFTR